MKRRKILIFIFSLITAPSLILPSISWAQDKGPVDLLKKTGIATGYSSETSTLSMSLLIGRIILVLLSLLGVIFLVLTFYAGFLWFTAGGDEKKVEKAKDYLKNGVIGLIIILASVSITNFVIGSLLTKTLAP